MDFLNSSSNLRGDFLLFTILKSPFKICVYLFKSISKNVSTLLGYMHKLIDAGKTVYATSYESKKDILANFRWENQGMEEKHVEYLFQYDGEDFEYKEIQVLDGDSIYLIHKVEYQVNMNC